MHTITFTIAVPAKLTFVTYRHISIMMLFPPNAVTCLFYHLAYGVRKFTMLHTIKCDMSYRQLTHCAFTASFMINVQCQALKLSSVYFGFLHYRFWLRCW